MNQFDEFMKPLQDEIKFEYRNLDGLKEYIFEMIGENENKKWIDEAINQYAEVYFRLRCIRDGIEI